MIKEDFSIRHIGPRDTELDDMLKRIGVASLNDLIEQTIPASIRLKKKMDLPEGISEYEYFNHIRKIASANKLMKSFIGMGYYNTIVPAVILRNILENPAWYTSYTPYQAEISQGRLEALLNFQTMVINLTGMDVANASLLDESTAAAEAMIMMFNARPAEMIEKGANILFIDEDVFPQNLDVVRTRSNPLGIEVVTGKVSEFHCSSDKIFGIIVQYPAAGGSIQDYSSLVKEAHSRNCKLTCIADIMSLVLLTPPGKWGADIVTGSTQRFGIPMGFGGPSAAYFATIDKYKRSMPGRIIGVSVDARGKQALRMSLQTREQHIKRERATSNICTAQALLATMAGMYAVYHGAEGLKRIAGNIHSAAGFLSAELSKLGYVQENKDFFDTLKIRLHGNITSEQIKKSALAKGMNFYYPDDKTVYLSIDETTMPEDIFNILDVFAGACNKKAPQTTTIPDKDYFNPAFRRTGDFLTLNVFNKYRSETEMMRYIKKLERKDFSLTHSMIPLGSCTMKLNAAVEMLPLSWTELGGIHPFAPEDQVQGYMQLIRELEKDLCAITGFAAISFQSNSGAAGEYAGLMVIREYHISRGQGHRNVALIPSSAHGTNPASAVMAGMNLVVVECNEKGNISMEDLRKKAQEHKNNLSCFMVTYPSTHGVFEEDIKEMIECIHQNGGLVYMDGANMNAQVGLTNPAAIGADVCHLNLHKTFAIPHGGGGPGMGPIAVSSALADFLPSHPMIKTGGKKGIHAISSAPFGSASILPISHAYIKMMGEQGLTKATRIAILNANYIASSLKNHYQVLYTGSKGRVAHEMILDCRNFHTLGITEADIAKRLMDYGFHAPTLSFPVHGTLMVEPTESESLQELDRFIDAMISIRKEIEEIEKGSADRNNNVLKNAPHTADAVISGEWNHPYSREKAAYPLPWINENKFFPTVSRINDAYGDRNLICTCAPVDEYREKREARVFEV